MVDYACSVMNDCVLSLGKFLSHYVLTYFSREAQKFGKWPTAICYDKVWDNIFL